MNLRIAAPLLLALFCVPACDDDTGGTVAPILDMSVTGDMAVGHDAAIAADSCAAFIGCLMTCTAANVKTCAATCLGKVSTGSQPAATALFLCIQDSCLNVDSGMVACADPSMGACQTCVGQHCAAEAATCSTK